jgi:hypothetical protein
MATPQLVAMARLARGSSRRIIVKVSGGRIQDVMIPKGCTFKVEVRDFTCNGCDDPGQIEGAHCHIAIFP